MNWVDGVLLVLLLASVIVGSKKGLIRELMAFLVFMVAIIVSVNYIDLFAVWVYNKIGGSVLVSAFLAFIFLLAGSYAAFKVIGLLFYKVANIKQIGRKDQMGGALVGFVRGWVAIGFLTVLVFLLPMPDNFYVAFENSLFGPSIAKTIPLMYDGTAKIHPKKPQFISQIEKSLLLENTSGGNSGEVEENRRSVHKVLFQMEKFFASGISDGTQ
jgi:membrane protein required for colicin V production